MPGIQIRVFSAFRGCQIDYERKRDGWFPGLEGRQRRKKKSWLDQQKKKNSNQVFWPKGVNGRKEPKFCQQILASALSYDDAVALKVAKVTCFWPKALLI